MILEPIYVPNNLDVIVKIAENASKCTPELQKVLAKTIEQLMNPPMIFKGDSQ